jgi:hypothetical protein
MTKIKRICQNCGASFDIDRWRLKNPNRGKFCSRECRGCSLKEVNKDFFKAPSANMAWVLGLMFSDGCYYRNQFSIKSIDRQLLETVKDVMESTYTIRQTEKTSAGNLVYVLDVCGSKLEVTPEYWGMHRQKTLTIKYPEHLPDEYAPDFIRGLFDGDGHVRAVIDKRRKNSDRREWYLLGTKDLLREVQSKLPVHCNLADYKKIAKIRCYSIGALTALYEYLYYKKEIPCLTRKRLKFEDAIKMSGDVAVNSFERVNRGLQSVNKYTRKRYYASLS